LLYPKALVGRLEISNDIRANVEVNAQKFHSASRSIDIEQVKELSSLVLRLEALSAAQHNPPAQPPSDPTSPKLGSARLAVTTSSQQVPQVTRPPSFLGPCIREDMTDEELTLIIESLTTRAENTMSTLVCPHLSIPSGYTDLQYFKHLGGFSSVLAALEQATRTDPRLIVHALALMNGAL
jgi:adenylate cyclase